MFGLKLFRLGARALSNLASPDEKQPDVNILGRLAKATTRQGLKKNQEDEFDETATGDPLGTYGIHDNTYKW